MIVSKFPTRIQQPKPILEFTYSPNSKRVKIYGRKKIFSYKKIKKGDKLLWRISPICATEVLGGIQNLNPAIPSPSIFSSSSPPHFSSLHFLSPSPDLCPHLLLLLPPPPAW